MLSFDKIKHGLLGYVHMLCDFLVDEKVRNIEDDQVDF